ncbi:hypothetical protein TcasGA2_TC033008 [Tribolium castaneum]|uniref:Uncharacterized protein n=1 Tax=Tribolium castaneum TaxID=7070 RepID=A0A139WHP4_TRICA|nr:hypothetical protein TcasGA2_TC033008 [Tribolium castaneum]
MTRRNGSEYCGTSKFARYSGVVLKISRGMKNSDAKSRCLEVSGEVMNNPSTAARTSLKPP